MRNKVGGIRYGLFENETKETKTTFKEKSKEFCIIQRKPQIL